MQSIKVFARLAYYATTPRVENGKTQKDLTFSINHPAPPSDANCAHPNARCAECRISQPGRPAAVAKCICGKWRWCGDREKSKNKTIALAHYRQRCKFPNPLTRSSKRPETNFISHPSHFRSAGVVDEKTQTLEVWANTRIGHSEEKKTCHGCILGCFPSSPLDGGEWRAVDLGRWFPWHF